MKLVTTLNEFKKLKHSQLNKQSTFIHKIK
jgi:hypothetical protein